MKLWLLRPVDSDSGPWDPWYDRVFGFVIRAETPGEARAIAQAGGGSETYSWKGREKVSVPAWTDSRFSTCEELTADGEPGIIIKDLASA